MKVGWFILVAVVLAVSVYAIVRSNKIAEQADQTCVAKHGVPVVIHGRIVCLAETAVIR